MTDPHWYAIDRHGVATLCRDEEDARDTAAEAAQAYPQNAPYRAVQLVAVENYDRMREALRWTAGTLQAACCMAGPISESSPFKLGGEARTVAQICDAADAALEQEQGGSDGSQD